jgi:quercetin dioxygenase-like cupin family protein
MNRGEQANEKQAVYVMVNGIESRLLQGCTRTFIKELIRGENLEINQITIEGSGDAEDYGTSEIGRFWYVLDGEANLRQGEIDAPVSQSHLIVVPPNTPWGPGLCVASKRLTLLDIVPRVEGQSAGPPSGAGDGLGVRVIRPEDVPSYQPAGHTKTLNRCLYLDEKVEIIEGVIDAGGGAQRHFHRHHEQMLYPLEAGEGSLLIYYPKGAPHGTEGGITSRLKLLVIYSPPLGESRDALRE